MRPNLVHVPSELIAAYDKIWGDSLLGDKAHSMIFDNTRIKRLVPDFACTVPFARGAEQIVAWAQAQSLATIDVYAGFPQNQAERDALVELDGSPNEQGSQLFARIVADALPLA